MAERVHYLGGATGDQLENLLVLTKAEAADVVHRLVQQLAGIGAGGCPTFWLTCRDTTCNCHSRRVHTSIVVGKE